MNILFLSLLDFNSFDERNIYTDLLKTFVRNGHSVYVVSPVEKRNNKRTHFIIKDNTFILKPRIGNTQKTNLIEKGISVLTLEFILKQNIKKFTSDKKFDLILYTTPPITFFSVVKYIKERDNAAAYLLLKDIFPQNAVDLGMLSTKGVKGILYRYFRKKEKNLYKVSDYIGCLSQANIEYLIKHNQELKSKPIEVCPNSIEPSEAKSINKNSVRKQFDIPENVITFIYGGNLGKPQDIDFVIECLKKNLEFDDRYFVICGSGTEYYKLERFMTENSPRNMKLINGLPKPQFDVLVSACDIGLVFLDHRFTIPNFPSRLLSYMEYSMPTLACTDSSTDLGRIIESENLGWWCESTDANKFLELANSICSKKAQIEIYGRNSRRYLLGNYTAEHTYRTIISHFQ